MNYSAVIDVKPLDNYKLKLKFENDEIKIFDMKEFLDIGLFKQLKNQSEFNKVRVCFDSIQWENGLDFDPEILYSKSVDISKLHH